MIEGAQRRPNALGAADPFGLHGMKITREFIEKHRTSKGGFTFAQCQALGSGWPPKRGWLKRAVEIEHTEDAIRMFVEFKERAPTKTERREQRAERYTKLRLLDSSPRHEYQRVSKKRRENIKVPRCDLASREFLETYEWRQLRMRAIQKYGRTCMCCGASPETGAVIHVDHIKPRRLFPMLAMDLENLQILCAECNHGKGNWDQTDWRPEEVDTNVVSILRDIAKNE